MKLAELRRKKPNKLPVLTQTNLGVPKDAIGVERIEDWTPFIGISTRKLLSKLPVGSLTYGVGPDTFAYSREPMIEKVVRKEKKQHFAYQDLPVKKVKPGKGKDALAYGAEPVSEEANEYYYLGGALYMEPDVYNSDGTSGVSDLTFRIKRLGTERLVAHASSTMNWWELSDDRGFSIGRIKVSPENATNILKFKWWIKNQLIQAGLMSPHVQTSKIQRP